MSIVSEIERLQTAKSSLKTSIENKGVSVSSADTLDSYNSYVSEIIIPEYSWYTMISDSQLLQKPSLKNNFGINWNYNYMVSSVDFKKAKEFGINSTTIPSGAFSDCFYLASVSFDNSTQEIMSNAFEACNLTSIYIPSNCYRIGNTAFYNNKNLTTVVVGRETPPELVGESVFKILHIENDAQTSIINENLKIYVPQGSEESYKSAQYWSVYADYIYTIPLQTRELTSATTCVGYDKYVLTEYQVSYNSGETWTTTATSATTLIEENCEECGYGVETKYSADLSDGGTVTVGCANSTLSKSDIDSYTISATTAITIGECVETIENSFFNDYSSLSSLTMESTTPPTLSGDIFAKNDSMAVLYGAPKYNIPCTIYVPSSSVYSYQNSNYWKNYSSKIQAIPNS